jgi:endonuclease-3 related protein
MTLPHAPGSGLDSDTQLLLDAHERLAGRYDLDRWHWQETTPVLDICLGAILVQHTAWSNVEKALSNLRAVFNSGNRGLISGNPERSRRVKAPRTSNDGPFTLEDLASLPEDDLAVIIRPAGMPLTKARRLQTFAALAQSHGGLDNLLGLPAADLRAELLATAGIGPETADVILLYAARQPAIVHDAYTQRLFRRLGLGPDRDGYDRWQTWLDIRLPLDAVYRGRYHAAIVVHCKETCRTRPLCTTCPLSEICAFAQT